MGTQPIPIRQVELRNTDASVGPPFYIRWKEDPQIAEVILELAERLWNELCTMTDTYPEWNGLLKTWAPYFTAAGARSQGRGRVVMNVSKVLNLVEMAIMQPWQRDISVFDWFFIGSLGRRLRKCRILTRKPVSSFMVESDDKVVKTFDDDGHVVYWCGDDRMFDHGMLPSEHAAIMDIVTECLGVFVGAIYARIQCLEHLLPVRCPAGIMIQTFFGELSGSGGTKVRGSLVQACRILAARLGWKKGIQLGMDMMNLQGDIKEDVAYRDYISACQLI
jgi:hypothetical protein